MKLIDIEKECAILYYKDNKIVRIKLDNTTYRVVGNYNNMYLVRR